MLLSLRNMYENSYIAVSYTHLICDCLRYITVWVFQDESTRFSLKRKRSKIKQENKDMRYYDIAKNIQGTRLVYVLPEYAGKFIMVSCYVNAVSYTHLDVYKRQVWSNQNGCSLWE